MGHDISSIASAARQSMSAFDPEFTKIYANRHGSKRGSPVAEGNTSGA